MTVCLLSFNCCVQQHWRSVLLAACPVHCRCSARCAVDCCAVWLQECIEGPLLAALDGESEASIASQMRATLTALLAASAPARPGYWVKLLAAVALAAGPAAAAAGMQGQAAGAQASSAGVSVQAWVGSCNQLAQRSRPLF